MRCEPKLMTTNWLNRTGGRKLNANSTKCSLEPWKVQHGRNWRFTNRAYYDYVVSAGNFESLAWNNIKTVELFGAVSIMPCNCDSDRLRSILDGVWYGKGTIAEPGQQQQNCTNYSDDFETLKFISCVETLLLPFYSSWHSTEASKNILDFWK